MKSIHDVFVKSSDEKLTLLSVSQRKILETSLGFVISLGLLPYLLPNVGISLAAKCKTVAAIKSENINDFTVRFCISLL